jgi:hypothetical protein
MAIWLAENLAYRNDEKRRISHQRNGVISSIMAGQWQ